MVDAIRDRSIFETRCQMCEASVKGEENSDFCVGSGTDIKEGKWRGSRQM